MRRLAILLALLAPASASASDGALLAAQQRYLPAAQSGYANTPDGVQARYEAGRDLVEAVLAAGRVSAAKRALRADLLARGREQVARAEALDRADGFRSAAPLAPLPGVGPGYGLRRPGRRRLPAASPPRPLGRMAPSASGSTSSAPGATRATRQDTRFAAASTVKLGALAAGAARLAAPGAQPLVVRRPPDRLLVVEPRREQDRRRASATRRSETGCDGSG